MRIFRASVAHNKGAKQASLEEVLNILMSGFLRGGVGFLKGTGEIIKGSSSINREVRVGVTHVSDYKYNFNSTYEFMCDKYLYYFFKKKEQNYINL